MKGARLMRKGCVYVLMMVAAQWCNSVAWGYQAATGKGATTPAENKPRLVVQLGHGDRAYSVAFSPDGRFVLTGNADRSARLWETASGREIHTFLGTSQIYSVAFSPDGRHILTGEQDGATRLWDVANRQEISRSAQNWSGAVWSVAFSPDGRFVLTGNEQRIARLLNAGTGDEIRRFEGHQDRVTSAAFSPDGRYVLSGSWDNTVRLWDAATGREMRRIQVANRVTSLAFSPDGRSVLIGLMGVTAVLMNVSTGREIRRFQPSTPAVDDLNRVAFSPDGRFILTFSPDWTARLWNATTGEEVRRFGGRIGLLSAVAFSPDGQSVLIGTYGPITYLFDVATGNETQRFEGQASDVYRAEFSPDGRFLLTVHNHRVPDPVNYTKLISDASLWDLTTSQEIHRFPGAVSPVAFSPDGRFVLTGSEGHILRLWDAATGEEIRHFQGHGGGIARALFSPDGRLILTCGNDDTIRLWDAAAGKEIRRFQTLFRSVNSVAFLRSGRLVLTYSGGIPRDATVDPTGPVIQVWDAATGKELYRIRDSISSFAVSSDGQFILTGSSQSAVRLWNADTGREMRQFLIRQSLGPSGVVKIVAFSPDGRFILTSSGLRDVRLWETATGKEIRRYDHSDTLVNSIVLSPDGRFFVARTQSDVRLWEVDTGKELQRFKEHPWLCCGPGRGDFSPDGRLALTLGAHVRFWNAFTGQELCRLVHFRDGNWAVVDPEGRFDTNNLEENRGLHWIMPDDPMKPLPLEIFMRDYYEPRLLARLLNGEQFKPVRRLSELNRVQPQIKIASIQPQTNQPDLVTVTVEVANARGEFKQGGRKIMRESRVYDLRLFRDGQLVGSAPRTNSKSNQSEVRLDATGKAILTFPNIRLPHRSDLKQVEFSAYAFNVDRVKSATARQTYLLSAPLPESRGRAYLISFGVNLNQNPAWNLRFAANDARSVQRVLSARLQETKSYQEVIAIPLISDEVKDAGRAISERNATKANFRAVLDLLAGRAVSAQVKQSISDAHLIQKATPEDLVLITVASHGYADAQGVFYLVPYDTGEAAGKGLAEVASRCISSDELSVWLREVDAGEIALIVDACHSAAAVQGEGFKPGPMGSRGLGQLSYDKGMRILTATQADNVALELNRLEQGLLTYALMRDGIEERQADYRPRDGVITVTEWLSYGVERVPQLYEEVAQGKRSLLVNGRVVSGAAARSSVVVGKNVKKVAGVQQPQLFDFARKRKDAVLIKNR